MKAAGKVQKWRIHKKLGIYLKHGQKVEMITQLNVCIAGSCLKDCALEVGCVLLDCEIHSRAHLSISCDTLQLRVMENLQLLSF